MKNFLFLLISAVLAFYLMNDKFRFNNEEPTKYPDEYSFIKRTYPYYNADNDVYLQALKQIEEMKSQKLSKVNNAQWEFSGPVNIGGRVVDIEFNPFNAQIVYAGSATGGVFKSTDKGHNWFPIFDDQATLSIGNIELDPVNPDIIYVGTGEPNGGHNNFTGSGVFKSTDAGLTWFFLGLQNTHSIGRIVIDPVNTNNVFVAATGSYFGRDNDRGIYKSTDGGTTWNQSLFVTDSTAAIDIIMAPDNPQVLYAAMWERYRTPHLSHLNGTTSGIYKTTDGGTTWDKISAASGFPQSGVGRIGLSTSKQNSNIIYALVNNGTEYIGLYKTTNAGTNWFNVDNDNEIVDGCSNFSWYFGQVRVDPSNDNIIYALDVSFMRSTDAGNSWPIMYGYSGNQYQLHVDHHALAFAPDDPNYVISGNDGGMNISTNKGVTWSDPVQLPATQFYEIGLDYNNPQKFYGGTQDNSTIRTQTGALDDWEVIYGGDGFYTIVDYSNPDIIYAESQFGDLGKSVNGGASFSYAMNGISFSEPTNWSTPVIMDFNNTNVLYYGTNKVYRTTNGAANWTAISPKLTISPDGARLGTITTIAVSPSNPSYIYCGTDDGQVWVTYNNGA
ncbi:MAG: WD40/YVTN/BNR-like repeat-containing protein, partial [Syntrophothermus sp.]